MTDTELAVKDTAELPRTRTTRRRSGAATTRPPVANQSTRRPGARSSGDVGRDEAALRPVDGIVDVVADRGFLRTAGYLPGKDDAHLSSALLRQHGLRRGDLVTGAVRPLRDGDRARLAPLVRVDTINGSPPGTARDRPRFTDLVPTHPTERLRLETVPTDLTARVIDLVMPVGKGQRALIVAPPKAGKTSVLRAVAQAISRNHPECHVMVVLVGERPEEVTDLRRSVSGEVIASTFDDPPGHHTAAAELAVERAKRLVESGRDVVVLLDSLTRLGRAYNLAAPASGRILSGGVDSTALLPPKRLLGAARNVEDGGSLTIFATALVETGSAADTLIFEEYKGTSNAELKLDRRIAGRRVYPAVDVNQSGTRRDELLLSAEERAVTRVLREALEGRASRDSRDARESRDSRVSRVSRDSREAIDLLLDGLRTTRTNIEFLTQIAHQRAR